MSTKNSPEFEIAIVGGGLVGLTAAASLAPDCERNGKKLALIAPAQLSEDKRTTALLMPSIDYLKRFDLWEACQSLSAPLRTMRLVDDTGRLIRAPLTDFKSAELGLPAFGYNIPNSEMTKLLFEKIASFDCVTVFGQTARAMERQSSGNCLIELDDGSNLSAQIVAACDGRHSAIRKFAGIEVNEWSYPQTAIVLSFSHSLPHQDISTEFHTNTGPFTQVPLPPLVGTPNRSSLVWVVRPEQADDIMQKPATEIAVDIEKKMQSYLGRIEIEGKLQCFPLSGMTAKRFGQDNVVLLGEAAHAFPPIGAQGFNLGLRDVAALEKAVSIANGDPDILVEKYQVDRASDVLFSTGAVDMLNRSLLADFLPVQALRAIGLTALGQFGWLRQQVMKRGMSPTG